MVCDNIFNHALCSSIWVCGPNWAVFGDGDHVRYLSCIVPSFFALVRWELIWSVIISSIMLFVLPYGFVGPIGQCSGMGIMFGT